VIIAVDDKILLVNAASLETEKTITVDQAILKIGFMDDGTVVVVTADSVRELAL